MAHIDRRQEADRLAALARLRILDTPAEAGFDRVTRLAADVFGVPIALVSLVDERRQWFKSRLGLDVCETPRDISFCTRAIEQPDIFVVSDAAGDARFADNPLVVGPPHIRFYAGAPLILSDGHAIGTLCVIDRRARTFSRNDERILRDLADIVIDEIELRGLMLQEETMRKEAEEASRAKSHFLSRMSHEIRTPLAGIIGSADLIQMDRGQSAFEHAAVIKQSATDLLQILSDILDLSKIEAGRMNLDEGEIDLRAKLAKIEALFRPHAEQKGIALDVSFRAEGATTRVTGDACRLRQVLINLVSNAIKFTDQGGVTVAAVVKPAGEGEVEFNCSVVDTGIGMSEAELSRIFDAFQQVDMSPERRFGGTGLGLSIVRSLLDLMGGRVEVTSTPGLGTRFKVSIVYPVAKSAAAEPIRAAPAPEAPPQIKLQGRRVLFADDNRVNREIVATVLRSWGCELSLAASGTEAIERFKADKPDLAILDIHMPGTSGLGVLQAIRESNCGERFPAVALTADAREEAHAEFIGAGFHTVITKPVNWTVLHSALIGALSAHQECLGCPSRAA